MGIDAGRYRITSATEVAVEDIDLDEEVVLFNGTRYTESDAERDSNAIAARHRGLSRGGVSLSGDGTHSPTVTTVIPRDVRDEVRARAAAEGVSVSKWLRRLIEREMNDPAA